MVAARTSERLPQRSQAGMRRMPDSGKDNRIIGDPSAPHPEAVCPRRFKDAPADLFARREPDDWVPEEKRNQRESSRIAEASLRRKSSRTWRARFVNVDVPWKRWNQKYEGRVHRRGRPGREAARLERRAQQRYSRLFSTTSLTKRSTSSACSIAGARCWRPTALL